MAFAYRGKKLAGGLEMTREEALVPNWWDIPKKLWGRNKVEWQHTAHSEWWGCEEKNKPISVILEVFALSIQPHNAII